MFILLVLQECFSLNAVKSVLRSLSWTEGALLAILYPTVTIALVGSLPIVSSVRPYNIVIRPSLHVDVVRVGGWGRCETVCPVLSTGRRRDANEKLKKKGVKGNKMEGDVADSDSNNGGTTDIKVKVRGKTRGSKTRGSNRGGRSDGSGGSESGDGGMTKLNVRVRASAKARRSTKATGKGNGHGKAGNKSSGEKDSAQGSQTDITRPARKRRKSAGGVVEDRTTDISGRRGKKGNKAAKGKGAKVLQENGTIRVIDIRTKQ